MAEKENLSNAPPIVTGKNFGAASIFEPENLLREARRQKNLPVGEVPEVCLLDPDGDIVRTLKKCRAQLSRFWACYHTDLYEFEHEGERLGVIGCAVGAPFAVLLAEQLFVSGCRFLVSMTSAGQILEQDPPPYFILIDRALRDEGTSYHYLPPADFVDADPLLVDSAMKTLADIIPPCIAARPGLQTLLFVKRLQRLRIAGPATFLRSRWRRQPCTPSRKRGKGLSCVLPM